MNRSLQVSLFVVFFAVTSAVANGSPFDGEQYQRLLRDYVQEGKTIKGIIRCSVFPCMTAVSGTSVISTKKVLQRGKYELVTTATAVPPVRVPPEQVQLHSRRSPA